MDTNEFVKNFFEKYYEKFEKLNLNYMPCVDKEMIDLSYKPESNVEDDEDDDWLKWKLIPVNITIEKLEEEYGVKFPNILKIFLTTYHHYFGNPIGANSYSNPFSGFRNCYNEELILNQLLPFAFNSDGYMLRYINLQNMPDELNCEIYEIDHEILFDRDDWTKDEIINESEKIANNFYDYLNQILHDDL